MLFWLFLLVLPFMDMKNCQIHLSLGIPVLLEWTGWDIAV